MLNRILSLGIKANLVLLFLIFPDDIFHLTNTYYFDTPSIINYKWLNAPISILFIPLIIYAFLNLRNRWLSFFILYSIILILRDLFFSLNKELFLFKNFNFEFLIFPLVSLGLFLLVKGSINKTFLKVFFQLHALSIYIGFLTGRKILNSNGLELFSDRFNAVNLDVGSSGLFMAIYLIITLNSNKKNFLELIFCSGALLLTGSRINILLSCFFIFLFFLKNLKLKLLLPIILLSALIVNLKDFDVFKRTFDLIMNFNFSDLSFIESDDSFIGRIASIITGFQILILNPLGVGFSFIDIQFAMQENGYPTFPHMGFLSWYLVLGPLLIILIFNLLKSLLTSYKLKEWLSFHLLSYIIIYNLIGGGLFVNFKIFFFYFLVYFFVKKTLKSIVFSANNLSAL